ncbi:hypothetical protein [Chryseobacterium sp.]|uniref:hypothetical protein n=1 Tax=Chryseobacterium sp. TaxID=1871047 RepID=UPI0028A0D40A|nr:hypothetical protein [Chryseobacterium sp.]
MQNIQDLKEKIFFESMNIIDNLDKINNVDELLSKQDLVDELANRISFLKLLEKNMEYFVAEDPAQYSEHQHISFVSGEGEYHDSGNEVTEEEAIFNNELNEIDENEIFEDRSEEEAIFNNQLNEIVESEFHENIINFVEENSVEETVENTQEQTNPNEITEEEAVFNNQLNEIEEKEVVENPDGALLNFVDEEKILADSAPDSDEDINEDMFSNDVTEEEVIFSNQLNEIDRDDEENAETKENETDFAVVNEVKENTVKETIPSIFDTEMLDDEMLIEEDEEQFISNISIDQGEMATDTSNVEHILNDIKNDHSEEGKKEENVLAEVYDRRKIVEIDKPVPEETEKHPSDESFENLEAYQQEKKIKLANIKGLKAVQSLFDDDPLEREIPSQESQPAVVKEDTGSILKSNIPTQFMEAEKQKPEFKLDLNDRIAFSKMLFEGSQTDLNDTVAQLNQFKTLEEAKEYLSDLYYDRKWNKVDEYAQRLWILVENKFL